MSYPPLTVKEIAYIRKNYMQQGYKKIGETIGRPWHWLRHVAVTKLGLRRGRWGVLAWTEKEISILLANYGKVTRQEMLRILPGRSWASILHAGNRHGMHHPMSTEFAEHVKPLEIIPTEAAYIAGLVDGEGSVGMYKTTNRNGSLAIMTWLSISNTDPKMLRFVQERCGGRVKRRKDDEKKKRVAWVYMVQGMRAIPVLRAIIPYMVTKKEAAEILEQYLSLRLSKSKNAILGEEEWAFYSEWRRLCPRRGSREWMNLYSI